MLVYVLLAASGYCRPQWVKPRDYIRTTFSAKRHCGLPRSAPFVVIRVCSRLHTEAQNTLQLISDTPRVSDGEVQPPPKLQFPKQSPQRL